MLDVMSKVPEEVFAELFIIIIEISLKDMLQNLHGCLSSTVTHMEGLRTIEEQLVLMLDNCNWGPLLNCWWKVRRKVKNLAIAGMFPIILRKVERSCTWAQCSGGSRRILSGFHLGDDFFENHAFYFGAKKATPIFVLFNALESAKK